MKDSDSKAIQDSLDNIEETTSLLREVYKNRRGDFDELWGIMERVSSLQHHDFGPKFSGVIQQFEQTLNAYFDTSSSQEKALDEILDKLYRIKAQQANIQKYEEELIALSNAAVDEADARIEYLKSKVSGVDNG